MNVVKMYPYMIYEVNVYVDFLPLFIFLTFLLCLTSE